MDEQIAELPTVIARFQVIIINTLAATTLLLYKILITSGQEIRYVWLTSWMKINVLHGAIIFVPFVDLLIILRICALYHDSKRVTVIVVAFWIGSTLTFVGLQFRPSKNIPDPLPGILPGCFLDSTLNTSQVIETIYFALAMYKLVIQVKSLGFSMTPLLKGFFRDGAGYCLMRGTAMYLFSILLPAIEPLQLQGISQLCVYL
ncbi:hypothetical protein JB92DRAFT_2885830 [Gautieria morchelliformis]|nr:hypothetical protein JB92DRAFT_2885830 [Gautieria morchelliformis]